MNQPNNRRSDPAGMSGQSLAVLVIAGGAIGTFEATRFATGRKNALRLEVNGSQGSLTFDFEDMNVLELFDATEPDETAGFRRILVTEPGHPYVSAWWPAGHGLGYEHGFTHQVVDLVEAIAASTVSKPNGLAISTPATKFGITKRAPKTSAASKMRRCHSSRPT